MFATLGKRLSNAFSTIGSAQRLSEDTLRQAVSEVRKALLEADVNYNVVKALTLNIEERINAALAASSYHDGVDSSTSSPRSGAEGSTSSPQLDKLSSKITLHPQGATKNSQHLTSSSSLEQQFIAVFREELLKLLSGGESHGGARAGATGSAGVAGSAGIHGATGGSRSTATAGIVVPQEGSDPATVLLLGLQGSGKTTAAGKIAHILSTPSLLNNSDSAPIDAKDVLLVGCDTHRPAAREQLRILSERVGAGFFTLPAPSENGAQNTLHNQEYLSTNIALEGLKYAKDNAYRVVVFDTAGRTHADKELMDELDHMVKTLPQLDYHILVADAMLGQRGVEVATVFNDAVGVSGVVLSKSDSDAKGGIALSINYATGVPIFYISDGERIEDISVFHAERLVDRLLGRGDLLSLADKVQSVQGAPDEKDAQRIISSGMNFNDLLTQMKTMRKMGGVASMMKLLPGMGGGAMAEASKMAASPEAKKRLKTTEAIIQSMTPEERSDHKILNGSRRRRIAKGSGVKVAEINRLVEQLLAMNKMMKTMSPAVAGLSKRGKGKPMGKKKGRRQKNNHPKPGNMQELGGLTLPKNLNNLNLNDLNLNDLNLNDLNKFIKP